MTFGRIEPIKLYVAVVSTVGLGAGAWIVATRTVPEIRFGTPAIAVLMILVIVGELYPIRVPLRDDTEDVTTSPAFMFATLLLAGPALAIVAQCSAALLSDVFTRKPWWKATFNIAQYALSITGAWLVLMAIAPDLRDGVATGFAVRNFGAHDFLAVFAAGAASFIFNNALVIVALAIAQRIPIIREFRNNLGFHTATTMVLIAQGPLIALAASRSIVWVLLFVPGIYAVYRTAGISVAKEQLASHDSLTGLPNRLLFRDRLGRLISEDAGTTLVVMLVDLDGFKEVNDTLGHHVGDSLLRQVGQRLDERLGEHMTVARLGGDEFGVIGAVADRTEAAALGAQVLASLEQPFALQDLPFHIEASVGGALYPEHAPDVDSLLQRADVAMYLAKEHRSGYEMYNANNDRYSPRRLALLGELRRALEQNELVLQFQPIADVNTGDVKRVEALVRWDHPEHGMLQPGEFIPLAEPTGLMGPFTRHVLDLAIAQARVWQDRNLDITVAVNVSARNLHYTELRDDVVTLLEKWSVPSALIELEITESALMADPRRATEVLQSLNDLGIATVLDDFGTGYSSLAYLKRLPVSQLKIDRSFVANMATDDEDAAIVLSTIDLARSLGLTVVAEGVESATVWDKLREYGCHFAQGYYLSRPLAADQMTRWLEQRNGTPEVPATPRPLALAKPLPPGHTPGDRSGQLRSTAP
jgi:diguanylate cyclase (GGDEF)-like protein